MFERRNQDVLADHYSKLIRDDDSDDSAHPEADNLEGEQVADTNLFSIKRRIAVNERIDSDSDDSSHVSHPEKVDVGGARTVTIAGAKAPVVLDSKRREKLLTSKKKLLKLKGKGTKLVFDDDGNAHQIYELEDLDQFAAKGAPEEQRRRFLEAEAERVRAVDVADKEAAREKRRTKKEKRKERERVEEEDGEGVVLQGGQDALANFIADAEGVSVEEEEDYVPTKRQKKWFEKEVDSDGGAERRREEPETLEDMETLASELLG
ncbi:hypothetical protein LTR28_008851 [Elasticomyces elasticus]|nr:hypothetical protein LTR28_008851 [Elasticomyces elasticus]